ncbi:MULTISPECIES: Ca2+-dependent phosphoinositide-specific phospholipase C [Sphingomonas]|uniref:Ca2+-dependent phosphoinositide-specific phospholipase C n=1 Tax=Sphingomonas TaxID=13687 RepID=UPI0009ECB90E|nr:MULTISPECIES: Ca2+-dependent phosphoinositide-specific phospholipase C [Sphingomonas]
MTVSAGSARVKHRGRQLLALLFAMPLMLGARSAPHAATVEGLPASLRIDQMRVLGSHNSYKPYPDAAAEARIRALAPAEWEALAYGHPSLETQLTLGLRQIEIDVAPDPVGGLYAEPYLMTTPESRAAMTAPGAKVLHIAGLDVASHCLTFRACLDTLRRWSDAHPDHLPITVLVNAAAFEPAPGRWPHAARFDAAGLDALDADLAAVIGRDHIITPDAVRGLDATLAAAIRAHRWPRLADARGRFLFVLDGSDAYEDLYRTGHPSLRGRLMFGYYPEDAPEASVFNIQDARREGAHIRQLVSAGFLVRTRADADTREARAKDRSRLDAAIASGAQFVSTDYYDGAPDPANFGYRAALPGGWHDCDPVTAPRCAH